jgi:prolyl-tRNA synthetase
MFSDADLIGISNKIIIGKKFIEKNEFEFKNRKLNKTFTINENNNDQKPSQAALDTILSHING